MSERVKIKLSRPAMFNSMRHETGEIVALDPAAAVECVGTGRGEWLDPSDATHALKASRDATIEQMRQAGRVAMQSPGSPWRASRYF